MVVRCSLVESCFFLLTHTYPGAQYTQCTVDNWNLFLKKVLWNIFYCFLNDNKSEQYVLYKLRNEEYKEDLGNKDFSIDTTRWKFLVYISPGKWKRKIFF